MINSHRLWGPCSKLPARHTQSVLVSVKRQVDSELASRRLLVKGIGERMVGLNISFRSHGLLISEDWSVDMTNKGGRRERVERKDGDHVLVILRDFLHFERDFTPSLHDTYSIVYLSRCCNSHWPRSDIKIVKQERFASIALQPARRDEHSRQNMSGILEDRTRLRGRQSHSFLCCDSSLILSSLSYRLAAATVLLKLEEHDPAALVNSDKRLRRSEMLVEMT